MLLRVAQNMLIQREEDSGSRIPSGYFIRNYCRPCKWACAEKGESLSPQRLHQQCLLAWPFQITLTVLCIPGRGSINPETGKLQSLGLLVVLERLSIQIWILSLLALLLFLLCSVLIFSLFSSPSFFLPPFLLPSIPFSLSLFHPFLFFSLFSSLLSMPIVLNYCVEDL